MTAAAETPVIRRFVVGGRGFEPLTPSVSRKCSPPELTALVPTESTDAGGPLVSGLGAHSITPPATNRRDQSPFKHVESARCSGVVA